MENKDITFGKQNSFIFKGFLLNIVIVGAVISMVVSLFYYKQANDLKANLMIKEKNTLSFEKENINKKLSAIYSDLLFLSKHYELHYPVVGNTKKQLDSEYLEFSNQKKIYDQVRFINKEGVEENRINFNNGSPEIVSDSKLQSKKERYYFLDSIKLNPGQIFVSPMDLNVENNNIEIPIKPTIRFGTPVIDPKGEKIGVIVLNYMAKNLLNGIKEVNNILNSDLMLVNSDGYWLYNSLGKSEWGFMFEKMKNQNFRSEYPGEWKIIDKNKTAQFETSNGIFTSLTLYPLEKNVISSNSSDSVSGSSSMNYTSSEYYWKLISIIPNSAIKDNTANLLENLLFLGFVLFVLSLIPAFIIALYFARKKAYKLKLLHMANYDKLTNIPNRALFMERLEQSIKISERDKSLFALLFIDIDGFKPVNDSLGHEAGDKLLKEIANRLDKFVRKSDTVARIGGDEFIVLLRNISTLQVALETAHKLLKILSESYVIDNETVTLGASIGVSFYNTDNNTADSLIKTADNAMYLAKKEGKNRIKTFLDLN